MSLSACIIVKDEEARLARCLNSINKIVDELIVLDTGSTDRTPVIAQELGAKVYHFPWQDDFAVARNEALKYATGEWILVLDADEILVPEVIPSLLRAITLPDYLLINLIRYEAGATQSPYSLISRLFRKHPQLYFSRPYHAIIDDSLTAILSAEPHWKIGSLPEVAIWHEGYQVDLIAQKNKTAKAQAAMEKFLDQHPTDAYVCSKLGALYVQQGNVDRGMQLLERALSKSTAEAPVLYEIHYHLGIAYRQKQAWKQAKAHYQAALSLDLLAPLKLGACINLGNLCKEQGELQAAQELYHTALEIDPNFAVAHYNLGMTLKAMGQFMPAITAYQTAIQLNPNYADAYQNLGVVFLKIGKVPESLAAFGQAISLHEQHNPAEAYRLRQGLIDMGFQV